MTQTPPTNQMVDLFEQAILAQAKSWDLGGELEILLGMGNGEVYERGTEFEPVLMEQRGAPFDLTFIVFEVDGENEHYHVPLLVSAWGYTTYRGS